MAQRTSTLVDWAFIALDRGQTRETIARLAWLWDQLEDACDALDWGTAPSHFDDAYDLINSVSAELGLPAKENLIGKGALDPARGEIFYRLTGRTEPLMITGILSSPIWRTGMRKIKDIPTIADLTASELEAKITHHLRASLGHYAKANPKLSDGLVEKMTAEITENLLNDLLERDRGPGAVMDI